MKLYSLRINTAQPTYQTVAMQQNQRGLLSVDVTSNGEYIRNLSVSVYDGDTEITPETEYGFSVEVGTEPKNVKVIAKAMPVMCEWEDAILQGSQRIRTVAVKRLQLDAGIYRQSEFYGLSKYLKTSFTNTWVRNNVGTANFGRIQSVAANPNYPPVIFYDTDNHIMNADVPIIVEERVELYYSYTARCTSYTTTSHTYPALGYFVDYQKDTLIRPSLNAPYDGEYTEPLSAVEIDGKKYEPTTLSVDGVAYSVLAAVPNEEPETEPETEG